MQDLGNLDDTLAIIYIDGYNGTSPKVVLARHAEISTRRTTACLTSRLPNSSSFTTRGVQHVPNEENGRIASPGLARSTAWQLVWCPLIT